MKETEWAPIIHTEECRGFEAESPGNHYGHDYEYRGKPKLAYLKLDKCLCHYLSLRITVSEGKS